MGTDRIISRSDYVRLRADLDKNGEVKGAAEQKLAKQAAAEFDSLDVNHDGTLDDADAVRAAALHRAHALTPPDETKMRSALKGLKAVAESGPNEGGRIMTIAVDGVETVHHIDDEIQRAQASRLVLAFGEVLSPETFAKVAGKDVRGQYQINLKDIEQINGSFRLSFTLPVATLDHDPAQARRFAKTIKAVTVVDVGGVKPVACRLVGDRLQVSVDGTERELWRTGMMQLRFEFADGRSANRRIELPERASIDTSDVRRWEHVAAIAQHQETLALRRPALAELEAQAHPDPEALKSARYAVAFDEKEIARHEQELAKIKPKWVAAKL